MHRKELARFRAIFSYQQSLTKESKGNDRPENSIELPCGRTLRPASKKKRKVSRIQMEGVPGTRPYRA